MYDKRVRSVDNIETFDDGDQLATLGTLIHDSELGVSSVIDTYRREGGLIEDRDEFLGHYGIVENEQSAARIYSDLLGSYSIYYGQSGGKYFVSNSLALVAQCTDDATVNEHGLFEYFTLGPN